MIGRPPSSSRLFSRDVVGDEGRAAELPCLGSSKSRVCNGAVTPSR